MNCPFCKTVNQDGAIVCAQCTRYMTGKDCSYCAERVPEAAQVCRYCSHAFESTKVVADIEPFTVTADTLGTLVRNGRLLTQSVDISPDQIVVSTPGWLGLSKSEEEIPWSKIAGYNYHSGVFWDAIVIETRGQTANRISPLKKEDAQRIRDILSQMKGM